MDLSTYKFPEVTKVDLAFPTFKTEHCKYKTRLRLSEFFPQEKTTKAIDTNTF